ncbi:hypothetical protein AB5I41_16970 [Sphingomonas sp. MMS24-JH45]
MKTLMAGGVVGSGHGDAGDGRREGRGRGVGARRFRPRGAGMDRPRRGGRRRCAVQPGPGVQARPRRAHQRANLATEWFRKAGDPGPPEGGGQLRPRAVPGRQEERRRTVAGEVVLARDEKRAELVLGTMLFNADGVPRDWTRAYALVTRSSQQGLPQGSQTLAQMDRYIPEAQRRDGIELAKKIEVLAAASRWRDGRRRSA